jgi:NADPH:quinone reductase
MQAVVITAFGSPEVLQHRTVPKPTPAKDEVLIRVKAFGLNHAEMHMRRGEWDEWDPISGLECVGIVEADPSGTLKPGQKVAGIMGGMGRSRPGGYGEFVTTPVTNVVPLDTDLPWEKLAALPEVYSCAYSCTHTVLEAQNGESILIRGATSTIGQAALHLAVNAGLHVTATTRRPERFDLLKSWGAESVLLEETPLATKLLVQTNGQKFDKVLNLIGNIALLDSIRLTRPGGRMLQAGWLGGLAPVVNFNPMVEMDSGVHFSLFHSKVLGTPEFPLKNVPLQEIVRKIERGAWDASPARVYGYDEIQKAHAELEGHDTGGKIVIVHRE